MIPRNAFAPVLFIASFISLHGSEGWRQPADFGVTTRTIAPNPGGWTATMGGLPDYNSLWPGGGFEQIHKRTIVVPEKDADDTITLSAQTMTHFDSWAEPFFDGAVVRVYRVINEKFEMVRKDRVPAGGGRASGWGDAMNGNLLKPDASEFRWQFPGWQKKDHEVWFSVVAVGRSGAKSAPSNAVKLCPPEKIQSGVALNNATHKPGFKKPEEGAVPETLVAPTNFRVEGTDADTGVTTFAWDAAPGSDIAGFRVEFSNYAPEAHRGYGLDLEGRAASEKEKIKAGDIVVVELDKSRISRNKEFSPRLWGTFDVVPPAGIAFHPDEDDDKTWSFVPHPGPLPADFTDGGERCLKIEVKGGAEAKLERYIVAGGQQEFYRVLEADKPVTLEVWMKTDPGSAITVSLNLADHGWEPPLPVEFTPTAEWKKYTITTTPTKLYESDIVGQGRLKVEGNGTVYLDNFRIYLADRPWMAPDPASMEAIKKSKLHAIRTHAFIKSKFSYSMKQLLGAPGANEAINDSLGNQLKYLAEAGTSPWLQVEFHMTGEEWRGLAEYLAAPFDPGAGDTRESKPWAWLRYSQGQKTPWTGVFEKVYFEISNETWNTMFAPWIFLGRKVTDAATGRVFTDGQVYGLWQNMVNEEIKASPYWPLLKDRWEVVIGGWFIQMGENGYGQSALQISPEAKHITTAPYNGGWDEGATPATADDKGRFLALTYTPQRGDAMNREFAKDRELLKSKGFDFHPGTYEAGPGYALPGTVNKEQMEAEAQVMKSLAGGAATLDAFLNCATYGYKLQNLFVLGRGRHFWNSHAVLRSGGQPFPWWRACTELYNAEGTGDFLFVENYSTPTWNLEGTKTRPALPNAPMAVCYATRTADRFNVFVISRKMDNHPVAGDDGFTPTTVRLPFAAAKKITLHKMTGDPRATNLDGDNVKIETVNLPPSQLSRDFVLNKARGADDRGLPPAGIFLYVFEGVAGVDSSSALAASVTPAPGQPAKGMVLPLKFTASFSAPVVGLNKEAVSFEGTAKVVDFAIQPRLDSAGHAYEIEVRSLASTGEVKPVIAAGKVRNAAGEPSGPSEYRGPTVRYEFPPETVTISIGASQDANIDVALPDRNDGNNICNGITSGLGAPTGSHAFVKFPVTNAPDRKLERAVLKFGQHHAASNEEIWIRALDDTAWDEKTITAATAPQPGDVVANFVADKLSGMEVDITDYIRSRLGGGEVSMVFTYPDNKNGLTLIPSKTYPDAAKRLTLELTWGKGQGN